PSPSTPRAARSSMTTSKVTGVTKSSWIGSCKHTRSSWLGSKLARKATSSASSNSRTAASNSKSTRAKMSTLRRRIVRPTSNEVNDKQRQHQLLKLRSRLERERVALSRWQSRLRRAFNSVDRLQKTIARIERKVTQLEATNGPMARQATDSRREC